MRRKDLQACRESFYGANFHSLPTSVGVISKKRKGHYQSRRRPRYLLLSLELDLTGRCSAKRDQPLSCANRPKSWWTTALEFQIPIILTPHLVPPALVFCTPKGYRYPRLRTPAVEYDMWCSAKSTGISPQICAE